MAVKGTKLFIEYENLIRKMKIIHHFIVNSSSDMRERKTLELLTVGADMSFSFYPINFVQ